MASEFSVFKELESQTERRISSNRISILRLDGSNFSSYTKQFEKPFSNVFERGMDAAAQAVLKHVLPNTLLCYVGSDEISFVVSSAYGQIPYSGRFSKLLTLSAAHATAGFLSEVKDAKGVPAFDGRLIEFEDAQLVREYITWRRLDVRKNATSMAAGALLSHRELLGMSTAERAELLVGTPFEKIPEGTFNGRFVSKSASVPATRELAEELAFQVKKVHEDALMRNK